MQKEKEKIQPQGIRKKWKSLKKHEKRGIGILLILVLGVLIFALGIEIGEAIYMALGR